MHRPVIDWEKNTKTEEIGSIEHSIFSATQRLIDLRKQLSVVADRKNITWLTPHNIHVAGFLRAYDDQKLYALFNYNSKASYITWYAFKEHGKGTKLYDRWQNKRYTVGQDHEYLIIEPYSFCLMEVVE